MDGNVLRFTRQRHTRASSGSKTRRKSLAVTSPSVTVAIFSATSREGQPLPSQSEVIQPAETPIETAKSPRLIDLDSRYSANFMAEAFTISKTLPQANISVSLCRLDPDPNPSFSMGKAKPKPAEKPLKKGKFRPTFIRQWRKKKGWSLATLGEKVGMTGGNLSEIETGNTGYTQVTLEGLATALGCLPVDLLTRGPDDPEGIWTLWDRADNFQRVQILAMVEAFLDASQVAAQPRPRSSRLLSQSV